MFFFPIKNVHPIILPKKYLQDINGVKHTYADMNPSLYIDRDGKATILVRRVNYKKFADRTFTMYQQKSHSEYAILKGNVSNCFDLNMFSFNEIVTTYNSDVYTTYWTGIEDIRFIDDKNILVIVPELNPSGNPIIFKALLNDNNISNFIQCMPNNTEKNWMPFENKVIYKLNPVTIKNIVEDSFTILDYKIEGYNGSTNGIELSNDEYLFLIHNSQEKTIHKWMMFNKKDNSITCSPPFVFFRHSYIEFTCSLSLFNSNIYVSLGVNDDSAMILELELNLVVQFMKMQK